MYLIMKSCGYVDVNTDPEFDLFDYCTANPKDVEEDFAILLDEDIDCQGIYDEVLRQGWHFDMEDIEDKELKAEMEEDYIFYMAKIVEI